MCAGNRIRKVCNRWCLHKNWISSKLHRREETTGSVCDEDSSSSLSYHKKSLAFFKALPRGREETMGDTVYGITSVLLLLLVLGFLIVFREFGMISE